MGLVQLDQLVLLSLLLQCILVFIAPLRKHMVYVVTTLIQLSYIFAIWLADVSASLIPNAGFEGGRTGNLRLFWAPFLILHLGGPDTITSLSLRDNELWLRHAGTLFTIAYTIARVFVQYSFYSNDLWLPTLLVFTAGTLKYVERLVCQFRARSDKFRASTLPEPDPGPNYPSIMEAYKSYEKAGIPVRFQTSQTVTWVSTDINQSEQSRIKLSQVQIVKNAHRFFHIFRGLFANNIYTHEERNESRQFFLNRDAEDAFQLCEVELNLAYDVFYTKAILIHKGKWQILRHVSLVFQLWSFFRWFSADKTNFHRSSVGVTYVLHVGTLVLELVSLFVYLTSDWQIAKIKHKDIGNSIASSFYEKWLLLTKPRRERIKGGFSYRTVISRSLFCRWSECIPQYSVILSSIDPLLHNNSFRRLAHSAYFTDSTRDFIFNQLITRSKISKEAEDMHKFCAARGEWILSVLYEKYHGKGLETNSFSAWISDVEYEESLMMWHIATDICYYNMVENDADDNGDDLREFSHEVSCYLLHLLIILPSMVPKSARTSGWLCFVDTRKEAWRFFNRVLFVRSTEQKMRNKTMRQACQRIMQVNTCIPPREIKGDDSKSVLFDACRLAKELEGLKDKGINQWEIMSNVWAEILFFTAAQCRPIQHVRKLNTGGQLVTLVWLLMSNLGIGKHFRFRNTSLRELIVAA